MTTSDELMIDALASVSAIVKCLDDGFVRLVDCMPRLYPKGYTIEYAIVRSARISYGSGLKDPVTDTKLLRYLFKNRHTSPFECVKFTFHIRCPKFVGIHLIRHRTANINEFSQRYASIKETTNGQAFYHPSKVDKGIREASMTNKQGSQALSKDDNYELRMEVQHAEFLCDQLFKSYQQMMKLGLAKEVARFCLPEATYTELYFTMDLHNLLHFLELRMDVDHAQWETVVYARAIYDLIKPLVPNVIEAFNDYTLGSMKLSRFEVKAIASCDPLLETDSKSDQFEYKNKLGILFPDPVVEETRTFANGMTCGVRTEPTPSIF